MRSSGSPSWSTRHILVFWWVLFLLAQQAERLFLLPDTMSVELPTAVILLKTLWTGFRADLIAASLAVLLAGTLAGGITAVTILFQKRHGPSANTSIYRPAFAASSVLIGLLLLSLLTVDMGYYRYNQQHLDFVFFEYLDDLFGHSGDNSIPTVQAAQQTTAEIQDFNKWAWRSAAFLSVESVVFALWWILFKHSVDGRIRRWSAGSPLMMNVMLALAFVGGAVGLHHKGPYAIRLADISSAAYYTLAQNPILYAGEAFRALIDSRRAGSTTPFIDAIPFDEAVRITQEVVGRGAIFPSARYPLVKNTMPGDGVRFERPANVLMIFLEGLDRRYLGRTIVPRQASEMPPSKEGLREDRKETSLKPDNHAVDGGVRLTPFLDRLKGESIFFEHFFSNGVQSSRGLFASFCSAYPRQGTAVMKTRYTHDYLCLPSLLRKAGYHTEMVIGQHRDINRLHLFMSRNGLHQLLDESDFPADAEKFGLGFTDAALFDLMRARIDTLQESGRPFFLATLTLGTHHPFAVPKRHPDVIALGAEADGYVAALRYVDLELERLFTGLRRDGLLKNTVVFILGDHGRHEAVGRTDTEKQVGHFTTPLFIWMDDSLRTPENYRPRTVSMIASQVDLLPTIVAMNRLEPRVSPFLGRDLSCALKVNCLQDNSAFLTSVYDDLIGLAEPEGLLLYSLRTGAIHTIDLDLKKQSESPSMTDPSVASRYRRLLSLYISSNTLLDKNLIWSWKEFGAKL